MPRQQRAEGARAPWPNVPKERRRIMSANRRRDTEPELRLRSQLHRRGLRFRVDFPIRVEGRRPVRPDIVFMGSRVAVFVDGCFWHGCPEHGSQPKSNTSYWEPKILRTQERDREADRALRNEGWWVLRFWEHDAVDVAAHRVVETVSQAGANEERSLGQNVSTGRRRSPAGPGEDRANRQKAHKTG